MPDRIKIAIEHIKEPAKHVIDTLAAGSSLSFILYYVGRLAEIFDKIINPILAGVGIIMTIIWTYYRIKCLKDKK